MKGITKTIKNIDEHALKIIEVQASKENVSSSQLIREQIEDYAKRLEDDNAGKLLHSYIDNLIMANNNVVHGLNDNTIAIGEMFKTILARLEMYFPDLNDEVERIQKNARPQEKNYQSQSTLMSLNKQERFK